MGGGAGYAQKGGEIAFVGIDGGVPDVCVFVKYALHLLLCDACVFCFGHSVCNGGGGVAAEGGGFFVQQDGGAAGGFRMVSGCLFRFFFGKGFDFGGGCVVQFFLQFYQLGFDQLLIGFFVEGKLSVFHFQHGDEVLVSRQQGAELFQADSAGFVVRGQKVREGLTGGYEAVKLGVHVRDCRFSGMSFTDDAGKEFSQAAVRLQVHAV